MPDAPLPRPHALLPSDLLVPVPARLRLGPDPCPWLDRGATDGSLPVHVSGLDPQDADPAARPAALLHALGRARPVRPVEDPSQARVRLTLDASQPLEHEAYRLELDPRGACGHASHPRGLLHAARTLAQLLRAAGAPGVAPARCLQIDDAPSLGRRVFQLDVSRDRVPDEACLDGLLELLAELKYDGLQLYFEHTFAYAGHESVWRDASPFTPDEVRDLDGRCASLGLELIPSQNSFGHLHHWLTHPAYAPLAECPEGIEHAFSVDKEPFSLCPTDPRSLDLLRDLYDQLLPCFRSRTLNVGLDETFDLGLGRSRETCEARGKGRVYLDFLRAVHAEVAARDHRMQFWGDIVVQHPELVPELPPDAVALEWGYEAGHPFEDHAALFAASGLEFWVCPGTSSWQSLLGRLDNARANLREAASAALRHGARGWLVTDWGDFGHWQPPSTALPGIVLGAARGWNAGREPESLAEVLDVHVLRDPEGRAGGALLALAEAHRALRSPAVNGTSAFFHLRYAPTPAPVERAPDLTRAGVESHGEALDAALERLVGHRSIDPHLERELRWAAEVARLGGELGALRADAAPGSALTALPTAERRALALRLRACVEEHRPVWDARSRPGGRAASVARLVRVCELLES